MVKIMFPQTKQFPNEVVAKAIPTMYIHIKHHEEIMEILNNRNHTLKLHKDLARIDTRPDIFFPEEIIEIRNKFKELLNKHEAMIKTLNDKLSVQPYESKQRCFDFEPKEVQTEKKQV